MAATAEDGAVVDEIEGGPSRPTRWRTRLALGVVGVLLFGYALTQRPDEDASGALPSPTGGPTIRTTSPTPSPTVLEEPILRAPAGRGPAGLRLLLDGQSPRIVDAATGVATAVPGLTLRAGDAARVLPLQDGYGVNVFSEERPPRSFILSRSGRIVVRLGDQVELSPAPGGNLYVTRQVVDADNSVVRTVVKTVTARGGTVSSWQREGYVGVLRHTPHGLLIGWQRGTTGAPGDLLLVDPATGQDKVRFAAANYVGASDTQVAWTRFSCIEVCELVITDLATGETRSHRMPEGRAPSGAVFAPDGHRVGLSFPGLHPELRPPVADLSGFVAVLDSRTGTLTTLDGLRTPTKQAAALTWSPDGGVLAIAVGWTGYSRIALWGQGGRWGASDELIVLPPEVPGLGFFALTVLR
jgi:hypothetical protein